MAAHTDQLGRVVQLHKTPQRIISIVPSQTELLYDLGLRNEVIGITKFCIHPKEWFQTKIRVGGTKNLHIETIKKLQPDLIIANKEENVQEQIEALANEFPVWISDVNTLPKAIEMILQIGTITNKLQKAQAIASQIETAFKNYKQQSTNNKLRTCYLIWKDPYMTIGSDTFIHDILMYAGFDNIFKGYSRYPVITLEELSAANCQLLLLSSEPYPFKQKHIDELQKQLPNTRIMLVDGEAFSWYGSRLFHTPAYLEQLQLEIVAIS